MIEPTKAGETFVARTKFPPNYQVPAHTHPYTESVTIISGSVYLGEGEKLDTQKGTLLKAGSYFLNLPKHAHYGWTTDDGAVVQVPGDRTSRYRLHQSAGRSAEGSGAVLAAGADRSCWALSAVSARRSSSRAKSILARRAYTPEFSAFGRPLVDSLETGGAPPN